MSGHKTQPDRAGRDIHETIRAEAEHVRSLPAGGASNAETLPGLAALMHAARCAIDASLPASFDFHGRRYYLRSRMVVQLEIFDVPAAAVPMVRGASISLEDFGHVPGH